MKLGGNAAKFSPNRSPVQITDKRWYRPCKVANIVGRTLSIVGLRLPMSCRNLWAGKQCEYTVTEYVGVFATTMTTQRLSIQSVSPSAIVWP